MHIRWMERDREVCILGRMDGERRECCCCILGRMDGEREVCILG